MNPYLMRSCQYQLVTKCYQVLPMNPYLMRSCQYQLVTLGQQAVNKEEEEIIYHSPKQSVFSQRKRDAGTVDAFPVLDHLLVVDGSHGE